MAGPAIALVGAGLVGRRHAEAIAASGAARLAAVADPDRAARALADRHGVAWHPSLEALLSAARPDGVILATPNRHHVAQGLACLAAGVPVLVEKPLAEDVAGATRLVAAAEAAGLALLVGHHRRHNPLVAAARARLADGAVGEIVAVNALFWLFKPDAYFDVAWRRAPGAGPVFINLVHDVDLLRHLVGRIAEVSGFETSAHRGHAVEDTAAFLVRFENGALGTISVSDTAVSPFSWEMTARENPAYPVADRAACLIAGTTGCLEVPGLTLWRHPGRRGWFEPIEAERIAFTPEDPLVRQVRQFASVIEGREAPLVPGREGLETLKVLAAMKAAAETGETVRLP